MSTAAKLRGVRRQTIYWHIEQGNLKHMQLDGNRYVDLEDLRKWEPKGKGEYKTYTKKTTPKQKNEF